MKNSRDWTVLEDNLLPSAIFSTLIKILQPVRKINCPSNKTLKFHREHDILLVLIFLHWTINLDGYQVFNKHRKHKGDAKWNWTYFLIGNFIVWWCKWHCQKWQLVRVVIFAADFSLAPSCVDACTVQFLCGCLHRPKVNRSTSSLLHHPIKPLWWKVAQLKILAHTDTLRLNVCN